jgi:hypothetical protein
VGSLFSIKKHRKDVSSVPPGGSAILADGRGESVPLQSSLNFVG